MAKKKTAAAHMSGGEQLAGVVFFVIYLLVLPFATEPLFELAEKLFKTELSSGLQSAIYYYALFAVTLIIFRGYLAQTTRKALDSAGGLFRAVLGGLVAFYGLNELVYRLTQLFMENRTNLNEMAISAQIDNAPRTTMLIVIFLAPFVEEVLFRGLVFGGLKEKNRVVAYAVSCILFALLHVWQFAVVSQDVTYLLLMVQYLVPGLVLAGVYDRSGTLWAPLILHMAVNAMAVLI